MSDRVIAFFEFKEDRAGLRFGVVKVLSRTLGAIGSYSSMGYRFFKESNANNIYEMLDGKIWIGHDIGSDVQRLVKAFAEIGINHPRPKSIFDTRILLSEKFAKLAVHFGLGNEECRSLVYEGCNSYDILHQNIKAIKHCEDVMSLYEPEKMKKFVGCDFHPMISYLMDQPTADVTALFREAATEICESAKERAEALLIKENANTKRSKSSLSLRRRSARLILREASMREEEVRRRSRGEGLNDPE